MSVVSSSPSPFELKNATLTLIALVLQTTDLELLALALEERFGPTPALFDHDPVVIDLSALEDSEEAIDWVALTALLRARRMLPVGVERGNDAQMAAALGAGLGHASTFVAPVRTAAAVLAESVASVGAAAGATPPNAASPSAAPVSTASTSTASASAASTPTASVPTRVIDRPLRSGQQVYARGGDLVVMAAVNVGAEVIADGHIHVYAPLRGRAIAGARGNTAARIFSTSMEPQLVSIAGIYRTTETALPADVLGKPAQVRLDGDAILVEALER